MNNPSILQISFLLFVVMNPIGAVPLFIVALKNFSIKDQRRIICRESILAVFVMFLFATSGTAFFSFLSISLPAFQVGGGALLLVVSAKMMLAPIPSLKKEAGVVVKDSVLFPFAFPILTGPGVMTSTIACVQAVGLNKTLVGIFFTGCAAIAVLMSAQIFKRILKPNHMLAVERLFGVLIFFIAVSVLTNGIVQVFY
ncbi:UPF0056 membrane protein [Candidatus Clavichlamydia salmonicola]|uniref:MarC family protein n=1 Tax=Candidatus Clavichlamydia salmonicola TaxID=469812 RepID=UPI001891DABE|nr:MarC family protein [Candidatus Clavichlamydia salmonicola]MBF5050430.1 UPF0056 membrane protein [Candidatus Clavichlamydia salmonicola]